MIHSLEFSRGTRQRYSVVIMLENSGSMTILYKKAARVGVASPERMTKMVATYIHRVNRGEGRGGEA